jgi:hypothetical protein
MYKYVVNSSVGHIFVKTPKVENFQDIKKDIVQKPDCIINHSIYPNGLDITTTQYSDKCEIVSNKRIIVLEDFTLSFED